MTPFPLPKTAPHQRLLRKAATVVVLASLLLTALVQVDSKQADALSSFDSQLLTLINNHRRNLGLNPLVEYTPLSNAALNWSTTMRNDSGPPCSGSGHRHDSSARIAANGMPPGGVPGGENIAYSCGSPGFRSGKSWSYGSMPSNCPTSIDYTSPLMMFCQWIDSAPHRASIENPRFTHIGVGSSWKNSGGLRSVFSTNRFAIAPVAVTSCDGRAATVNLARGQRPTNGSDVIIGTAGPDSINGLGGNDIICGLGGNDTIVGGEGDDKIFGGDGNDNLQGNNGRDKLYGERGNDTIDGGAQGDSIFGSTGSDNLSGGGGWDWIYGGSDQDTIRGGTGSDKIFGGASADRLFGDNGPDKIEGGDGNDIIDAGKGQDVVSGGNGNDNITGNNGPDKLWGNGGSDTIRGGRGTDFLYGSDGNDALSGEGGWDTLNGGAGSDRCDGGWGRDSAGACESRISVP